MDTHAIKERLEAELEVIEGELQDIASKNPNNPSDWEANEHQMDTTTPMADPNESADKIEEYNENRAIVDELEIQCNNIKRALDKIKKGTYGTCEISGELIEEDRLLANPTARTCKAHMDDEGKLAA